MEASWLQDKALLGPLLENGVSVENITIHILKIRFWRVQGHTFSSHVGKLFGLMRDLASGHPSDVHFSEFWPLQEANLAPSWDHVGVQGGLAGDILATATRPSLVKV